MKEVMPKSVSYTSNVLSPTAIAECEQIRERNDGLLRPIDLVSAAKSTRSALHDHFEWDDQKCGHEYRLWQARELIATIVVIHPSDKQPIRAFVSLGNDRTTEHGGYRFIEDVLADPDTHLRMLSEALGELQRWQTRYSRLTELTPVFKAIARVQRSAKK